MASKLRWFGAEAMARVDAEIGRAFHAAGSAWVARARDLAPVDTENLKSLIGFTYDAAGRRLTLYCDASYAVFQEFGTRLHAAHPFMRPALSAIPRIFRGLTTLQASNTPEPYVARTEKHAQGKTRGARLRAGHGKFR